MKFDKYIDSNAVHAENIEFILVKDDVLKLVKSIDFIELHPENIESIFVIKEVLILEKSTDCNELQPENKESKFVINEVSKWDKSIDAIFSAFTSLIQSKKFSKLVIFGLKYITIFEYGLIVNVSLISILVFSLSIVI